jgi:hypothetical protein
MSQMKTHFFFTAMAVLAWAPLALAGLGFETVWQAEGKGAFSAPNAVMDTQTGKILGIVTSESDAGIACFDLQGRRLWSYAMTPPVTAAPAVADVNGDGREEIVAADSKGTLAVFAGDGALLWSAELPGEVSADSCPAVVDLDGDGKVEIVVGDASGTVSCLSNTGDVLWRFAGDGTTMGPVMVADIYDSPGKEIVVTSHDRHVYMLTARGEWIWDLYFATDLFPNTLPILADVDGDGVPELYIGGGLHHFYRIDPRGPEVTFEENVYMHINGAIDAADLDGDGKDEVVFGNKGAGIWCYGNEGFRWKREMRSSSLIAAPVFLNLNDDPQIEILFFAAGGEVHALDASGKDLLTTKLPVFPTARPLVGDLDQDGKAEIVLASGGGSNGNGIMLFARLGVPYRDDLRNRTVYAQDHAHTGRAPGAPQYALLPTPPQKTGASQAAVTTTEVPVILSGPNTWRFDVANPERQRLAFLVELGYPGGAVERFVRHIFGVKERAVVTFPAASAGRYRLTRRLVGADTRTIFMSEEQNLAYEGFGSDKRYLEQSVFADTEAVVKAWRETNPSCAEAIAGQLGALQGMLAQLAGTDTPDRARQTASVRESARRLRQMAIAGQALAGSGSFFAWQFTPWAYFDGRDTQPAPEDRTERLETSLCMGEYESLALNVTNATARTLQVRVLCKDPEGTKTPVAGHVEFRRAVTVAAVHREQVADALPRLDDAGLVSIAPLESEQLWITVNADGLQPGIYEIPLRLKSVEPDPTEVTIPIRITVYDLALPRPHPLRMCLWTSEAGDLGTRQDPVLHDLVTHGVTVYLASAPKAKFNENGDLIGEPDFAEHDEAVRRLSPHGLLLYASPQGVVTGPPFLSDAWKKAFISYLRAWTAHMKGIGLDYDAWALYPYDEPSTPFAETTVNLVAVAKVIREADPNILIYADPTSGTTMETVKMFTGLIDIWQPSSELLERLGPELVPEAKRVGKHVWFYDAAGNSKTLSCLGIYRWRFWYAWQLGLTGVGWWVYAQHGGADRWDGPNPTGDYFATVYDGPQGPVSSKRWEAAREGVEDYEYLYLLRESVRAAEAQGVPETQLADAKRLLQELPKEMESTLLDVGRRLPLTADSVPTYKQATDSLNDARRRIVAACLKLKLSR